MGVPLQRAAIDAVFGVDEDRSDCAGWVNRLGSTEHIENAAQTRADCETDGHYLCSGCARMSGRALGRILAENPHLRVACDRAQAQPLLFPDLPAVDVPPALFPNLRPRPCPS